MVFSDPIFLFCFLPILLTAHSLLSTKWRNVLLILGSLLFYAWGEGAYVVVMLASIAVNFRLGLRIGNNPSASKRRYLLWQAIGFNLAMLVLFKYTNFIVGSLASAFGIPQVAAEIPEVHLPIGISFFTFQALSYVIDVYRGQVDPQRRFSNLALYITSFPQLIAGPIVRYCDVNRQIAERTVNFRGFRLGIERFTIGLGKKMIIANTAAEIADSAFAIGSASLSSADAWIGAFAYAIQIYFDFSGYSDMAIGMGLMLGFRFAENFNYPYIATSITDFWRRWHISLSTWFRDYLYIPLGGNRKGPVRTYVNLMLVFLLCGLWHGASWTFVLWGAYHGMFLIMERTGLTRFARKRGILNHLYAMLVVLVGWVLFRAETAAQAGTFLEAMCGLSGNWELHRDLRLLLQPYQLTVLCVGVVAATPVLPLISDWRKRFDTRSLDFVRPYVELTQLTVLTVQFVWCACLVVSSTYNPFIYFRF